MARSTDAAPEVGPKIACRVALAVANDGSVGMERYVELCGDLQTAKFLLREIYSRTSPLMIRFENTILESANVVAQEENQT